MTDVLPSVRCAFRLLLITTTQTGSSFFFPALIFPSFQLFHFKGGVSMLSALVFQRGFLTSPFSLPAQAHTPRPRPGPRSWSTRTCSCFLVGGHGQALTLCTSRSGSSMKSIRTHPPKTGKSTSGSAARALILLNTWLRCQRASLRAHLGSCAWFRFPQCVQSCCFHAALNSYLKYTHLPSQPGGKPGCECLKHGIDLAVRL